MKNFYHSPDVAGGSSSAAAGGSQVTSGSVGSSSGGQGGVQPDGLPGAGKTKEQLEEENRFVRPDVLKGILGAKERAYKESLEDLRKGFTEEISSLKKVLEEARSKPTEAKNKDGNVEDPEKVDLKRRIKESEEILSKVQKELETTRQSARKTRREQAIKQALLRQGCTNPEYVYRMIDPDLQESEENGELYTLVQSEYGKEKILVDDYVKRFVAKEQVPQLFQSSVKQGAPAGGDAAGTGKFKFKGSQLKDTKFYSENHKEIVQALDQGLVDWKN